MPLIDVPTLLNLPEKAVSIPMMLKPRLRTSRRKTADSLLDTLTNVIPIIAMYLQIVKLSDGQLEIHLG